MPPDSIGRWIARVFAWLLPCFVAWYFGAGMLAALQAWLATLGANTWFPGLVSGWQRNDAAIEFVTRLHAVSGGRVGDLVFSVNARVYSYGLALYCALCLATDARRWQGLALGAAALVPVLAWGVMFDLLQQVFITNGALAARDYLPTNFERNFIGLAYQAGSILLPTAAPALAWALVHRRFLAPWMAP